MILSLITVCHKSSEKIITYINSFLRFHDSIAGKKLVEFVFIENSGQTYLEKAVEPLVASGFDVRIIDSKNEGFGAGCNLGALHATGELLVFVNPDVRFLCSLEPLFDFSKKAVWGTVRQMTPTGRMYSIDFFPEEKNILFEIAKAYIWINVFHKLFLGRCYVVGSFLVVRRDVFEAFGRFNEKFFLYYEEAELCRRLQLHVGPLYIEDGVSVFHEGFGSHETHEHVLRHEANGFLTYCRVTLQPTLPKRTLSKYRVLGLFSAHYKMKHSILKELMPSAVS